ncbi:MULTISPECIES: hypothetical protein [Moorena]|uniref:hypothetical protein n=1 Tax=Moorena TaxID=1155738 RepID=UPI0012B63AD1|nr:MULTISPECIES: hypothetical protein [Moorena]
MKYTHLFFPDSRFPTPVPLLGGVRGGFRFPFPSWEGLGVGSDSRFPIPSAIAILK